MMEAPPVQYVTTSDGLSIAYGVSGGGMPLLFLPGVFYHVQLAWQYPGLQPWLAALSKQFQLVQVDPRGTGMSSRDVPADLAREHYSRDLEAVVARLGLDRFVILGTSLGVDIAVHYALHNHERVAALVLSTSGLARADASLFQMLPAEDWDAFLYSVVPRDRTREEAHKIVALTRLGSDQRNYLLRRRALVQPGEIEALLAQVRTPTLILHARDYALTPVEEAMKKAQLTGGRLVLIDGSDPWGDVDQGMRAIEAFLAELALQAGAGPGSRSSSVAGLSAREMQVLRLIADGRSNPQIADALVISLNTVQRHVSNILAKTGAANRTEAAVYAKEQGLV